MMLQELFDLFHANMYNTLNHEEEVPQTEKAFSEMIWEIADEEADRIASRVPNAQELVEEYGTFKAIKCYDARFGYTSGITDESEEQFYATLLYVILREDDEGLPCFNRFQDYCEENPLNEAKSLPAEQPPNATVFNECV